MPKLFVDMTTTVEEQGRHPHGTTRVERGIVSALAAIPSPDKLGAKIHFMANADDQDLRWLYENCRFTVFLPRV